MRILDARQRSPRALRPRRTPGAVMIAIPERNPMPRTILPEAQIHPAVREKIANYRTDVVKEVQMAVATNAIVVVGMRQNPHPKKARKALDAAGLAYQYLEYGSYLGEWRRRLALKMWTGWPTFPMVLRKSRPIRGGDGLARRIHSRAPVRQR